MRTYSPDSPEAAARIIALLLVADGHVCRSEIEVLNHLGIERELGLQPGSFGRQVQVLCEDLLLGASTGGGLTGGIDAPTLAALMAEIKSPELQRKVLALAGAAAEADEHLAEAELIVLSAARQHWGLTAA